MQAPGQVQRGCGEGSEGSREGLGGFGAETGQVQHGSGDPEKVPGSLAAKQSQVQQGSGAGSRKGSGEGQVTFNRDPEKVWEALVQSLNRVPEKVPEKVWEALVQSQVTFNRVPEKVPEKVWEALMQSQVRFNRVPKKVPEKVLGGCGAEPGQVQQGSEEGSGEGVGVFGAEPGQVQQGLGEGSRGGLGGFGAEPGQVQQGSGEGLGGFGAARSGSTEFQRRFLERSCVQSQVRFNRALEKVPENVPGSLGAKPSQVPRVPEKVAEVVRRRFLGIFGAGPGQVHRFNMVSSAWLRSTLQEDL